MNTKSREYKNLSDEEIVKLVISKDHNLYEFLVRRYQKKLLSYVGYYIPDYDKAADVVQDVFIKSYINLQGFNSHLKFSSWLYRIAHNESINAIKKYHREVSLEGNENFEAVFLDHTKNIEEIFEKKELRENLKRAVHRLPFKYEEVIILYYFEEKSYEEISDVLRISLGAVGTRINRAKKMLVELYTQHP
ncbi:hypothetical protein A2X44_04440 [candidate division CPR3 bacterium GWF2_35_18]|uniref:RNA polymerase, sigma-24 subunit, ECF subfamily n=1 Tax=candidate division CPR3 bacterium GW2011_GWF2_35_18 TaxID=1618350 RepID=A0A0G0EPX3_UNCC3|nr:MAG: RNA polymerase, sigma-24 subunit, ECF subfamily [candidate division CPR3 bacterium GW2011_GWF2_35_18]KKP85670.1 MAG: RNA polymerase, sigma-24 subunit, ECF subfamily [candidate division CPR3 bacterium GW2011_GWE2_35_7]OGB62601.1 MAG: hypothetical protein A2X44_04440 [candidate division CPR3 bacterium GWF2_35_18]OGB65852.1 MAG: hypothetical protein A2250_01690 [candidate division CPR3 bacterium RIFOXYA2_FULL_35_13]OGB76669.1 MAG: hypothetical protein A2476_03490 [candidate division CPR3 b